MLIVRRKVKVLCLDKRVISPRYRRHRKPIRRHRWPSGALIRFEKLKINASIDLMLLMSLLMIWTPQPMIIVQQRPYICHLLARSSVADFFQLVHRALLSSYMYQQDYGESYTNLLSVKGIFSFLSFACAHNALLRERRKCRVHLGG